MCTGPSRRGVGGHSRKRQRRSRLFRPTYRDGIRRWNLCAFGVSIMAFSLTRPPSPSRDLHNPSTEVDHLSSALHAALSSLAGSSDSDMAKEKERSGIEILVESSCVSLRGTNSDAQPALLSGHVVLNLTESTSIKEITLQFRGKVRLPTPLNEQFVFSFC